MISGLSTKILSPIPDVGEPRRIPGTDYRADCAVGQLRPMGMKPCSDEQLTSQQLLCQQHRYPTSTECGRRLEYFDQKADDALVVTLDHTAGEWYRVESRNAAAFWHTAGEWYRVESRNAAAFWRKEASRYRRFLFLGLTSDVFEWQPPEDDWGALFCDDSQSVVQLIAD